MSNQTKFTVLVPTRERADTLYYALRTLTQQHYDNLSIVVSDNASTDRTEDVVRQASDSRIRYVNTGARVSMSHNFEFALSHVEDGWVTFLGDDDGLLPGALDRVNTAIHETGCTAVTSDWCYYRWPRQGLPEAAARPLLSVPLRAGYQVRTSQVWLKRLLNGEVLYPELPWLYTGGFASIDLVRNALDASGKFFRSRIPDVYSAIAMASVTKEYVHMRAPVALSGVSVHSTGTAQMTGHHRSAKETFASEENLPPHPLLGGMWPTWSMPLFVYESYLQALELHKDDLHIPMAEQLGLALSEHVGPGRTELENYVKNVAERNGIDFGHVVEFARKRHLARSFGRQKRRILWLASRRSVNGAHGARNVLEASWVANAVYGERTEGYFWRTKEIGQRVLSRLKTDASSG